MYCILLYPATLPCSIVLLNRRIKRHTYLHTYLHTYPIDVPVSSLSLVTPLPLSY